MDAVIDVGGTFIRLTGFDREHMVDLNVAMTKHLGSFETDMAWIDKELYSFGRRIDNLVIGLPGNERRLPNLPSWQNKPLRKLLSPYVKKKLWIENDAVLASYSELSHHWREPFWFIIWGTGIGGVLVNWKGNNPAITNEEIGHYCIYPDGYRCHCGQKGCLEAYCGGASSQERFKKLPGEFTDIEWNVLEKDWLKGLETILTKYPTNLVIFGGGISAKQTSFIKKLNLKMKSFNPELVIKNARFENEAALFGGIAYLRIKNHEG